MDTVVLIIQSAIICAIPLLIVALAGAFSEKSGIINLALEGGMIFGAFIAAIFVAAMQKAGTFITPGASTSGFDPKQQLLFILALLIAGLSSAAFTMLLSFAAIKFKCDQTIIGTALNMLAPAIMLSFSMVLFNQEKIVPTPSVQYVILTKTDGSATHLWEIFTNKIYISTYICIVLFVFLSIWMYKSKIGTHMRACGEHPQAAASVGVNVYAMRYLGTAISGFLAGIGGYTYIATVASSTAESSVGGRGFLALAIMIFGNWSPLGIAGAAGLFGLLTCIGPISGSIPGLKDAGIPEQVYSMIPYVVVLVVLVLRRGKNNCPKAEGIPYDKGLR